MPTYYLLLFRIPRAVRIKLERIRREFLLVGTQKVWKEALDRPLERMGKEAIQIQFNSFSLQVMAGIRFWEDFWCSEAPLCRIFPALYAMARSKGALISELWTENCWNFNFSKSFNDWELGAVQTTTTTPSLCYRIVWRRTANGSFSVKSSFEVIEGGRLKLASVNMLWLSASFKRGVFCLGILVGENPYFKSAANKGFFFSK